MLEKITGTFSNIVRTISGKSTITEKNIEETVEQIKMALLEADVNLRVVRRFVNSTIEEAKGEKLLKSVNPGQQFVKIIHDKIVAMLGDEKKSLKLKGPDTQTVILMLGLQGAGKTTASHKLAAKLKKEGRRPLLVACDLVRPAAVEQLCVLGEKIGVPVYKEDTKDAVKVAKNGLDFAKKNQYDTVIIDTAGRLQIDEEMMAELVKVKKTVTPDEILLVADSMTGQNAVDIAKSFDEQIGLTGVILTKFDSDARGGAALSLKTITEKPILFIGTGEKTEDFEQFYPDRIDMLAQFQQVKKMGSMQSLMEMIPGMGNQQIDTSGMKKQEAIILSMTKKERANHLIIGPSRRKRIAKGSGTSVAEVNKLIKQFEKTKLTMKKLTRNKGLQSRLMSQLGGGNLEDLASKLGGRF